MSTKASKVMQHARERARRRGVPYELNTAWYEKEIAKGRCAVTGLPFVHQIDHPQTPTIDRIVPKLGYTPSNCRVVINGYNQLKAQGTDDDAVRIARAVLDGCRRQRRRQAARQAGLLVRGLVKRASVL